ncbi:MAG TPA: acetylornithine deacetylase [Stellaceae bacterium]|nr:acetylornithine deacetylase [Stellaceae bacterium]
MTAPRFTSIEMIRKLVGFDTTSRDSNLALIDFVRGYLAEFGIASELFFDAEKRKANLFATLGPKDRGGVMLSGHTDVVPVDGQEWSSDPFEIVEREGKLYGRGTSDMKSFVAVALALVPEFLARELTTPIHIALSYDEEIGCVGVRGMIAEIARRPVRPKLCIVGEPTLMQPVIAHKGKISIRCRVRGLESHSALTHLGVNAVEAAAEIIAHLKRMARRRRDHGPFDRQFSPPYTTIHTGTVHGGTALNIVPRDCEFVFEFRTLPGDPPELLLEEVQRFAAELEPEMHKVDRSTGISFEILTSTVGLSEAPESEVAELARALSGANSVGKVSFGTEAGLFQEAGIPTVVCGPGSIDEAHRPNEFIALEQIRQCEAFLRRLIERAAS